MLTNTHTHTHIPVTPRGIWGHAQVEDSANSAWVMYWYVCVIDLSYTPETYTPKQCWYSSWNILVSCIQMLGHSGIPGILGRGVLVQAGYCNSMRSHIMPSWVVKHCSFGQAKYSGGVMQRLWGSGLSVWRVENFWNLGPLRLHLLTVVGLPDLFCCPGSIIMHCCVHC